jgi:PAS domain S-box-containing protein
MLETQLRTHAVVALVCLVAALCTKAGETALLTNVAQIQALGPQSASPQMPVHLRAVVTYADLQWNLLFIQDDTGAMFQLPKGITNEPSFGDLVEVTGTTVWRGEGMMLDISRFAAVGRGQPPEPAPADEGALLSGTNASRWVEVEALVRRVEPESERLRLDLLKGTTRLQSYVRKAPALTSKLNISVGSRLRVRGVCSNQYRNNRVSGANLMIPDESCITILEQPALALEGYPVTPVAQAQKLGYLGEKTPRVRLQGVVVAQRQTALTVRDDTGSITVLTVAYGAEAPALHDRLDVWGYPRLEGRVSVIEDAVTRAVPGPGQNPPQGPPSSMATAPLHTVREVRSLRSEQAGQHPPVELTGVVTYADPTDKNFFLQDDTGAIYVRGWGEGVKPGRVVKVEGQADPGTVARMIVNATVRAIGQTNLPAADRFTIKELLSRARDCAWVQVDGVVRSVDDSAAHVTLEVATREGSFEAVIRGVGSGRTFRNLVDAEIRLRGVNTVQADDRNRFTGLQLRVSGPENLEVLVAAPTEPFALDPQPIGAVSGARTALLGLQRVHVRGVVTMVTANGDLYVQERTGAVLVHPAQANQLQVGTSIDVAGFPEVQGPATELSHAVVREASSPITIEPRLAPTEDVSQMGQHHCELVVVEGHLLADSGGSVLPSLLVQSGSVVFNARFEAANQRVPCPVWRAGSLLRVTGVCKVDFNVAGVPRSFALFLRSPADVVVLQTPPWWTFRHTATAGGLLGLSVIAVLGWVHLLRRQVREQTGQIRQRLEAEANLTRELTVVWEASTEGMRINDERGVIVRVNQAYCRLVEKDRAELEGQPLTFGFAEAEHAALLSRNQQSFASRSTPGRQEHQLTLWNGRTTWLEITSLFLEQPGRPTLLLTQLRDVIERKRAESEREKLQEQFLQAQKMESVGRLAGGVAHDFNNMLQAILGNTALALHGLPASSPLNEFLQEIQKSAERSAELTRQLLAFARRQTIAPKVLDLNATVEGILKILRRLIGENIDLTWAPGPGLWTVRVDPTQLDQILANLCVNARDAIGDSGKVTISTANASITGAESAIRPGLVPGEYVRLIVRDNGCGMDPKTRAHLFEPFFTTKGIGRGTGLGLATVYGIVKQNRGLIQVDSELGQGTTFTIYLPRHSEPLAASHESPAGEPLRSRGETVLLVEDEPAILAVALRILRRLGYDVLTAATPADALRIAESHAGQIHLLVTDVVMPGMNGRELARHVLARFPAAKCLYISGYTADVIAHHGVLDDDCDFIEKPFSMEALAAKLRAVLEPAAPDSTAEMSPLGVGGQRG